MRSKFNPTPEQLQKIALFAAAILTIASAGTVLGSAVTNNGILSGIVTYIADQGSTVALLGMTSALVIGAIEKIAGASWKVAAGSVLTIAIISFLILPNVNSIATATRPLL